MSAAENLNNAIASLSGALPGSQASAGVKTAGANLVTAWVRFWNSSERHYTPDAILSGKYRRFLEWYARAFVLSPKDVRTSIPDPRSINVEWSELAADTMRTTLESYQDAGKAAVAAGKTTAHGALKVAKELSDDVARAGAGIAAPIQAYGEASRNLVLALTFAAIVGYVLITRSTR